MSKSTAVNTAMMHLARTRRYRYFTHIHRLLPANYQIVQREYAKARSMLADRISDPFTCMVTEDQDTAIQIAKEITEPLDAIKFATSGFTEFLSQLKPPSERQPQRFMTYSCSKKHYSHRSNSNTVSPQRLSRA